MQSQVGVSHLCIDGRQQLIYLTSKLMILATLLTDRSVQTILVFFLLWIAHANCHLQQPMTLGTGSMCCHFHDFCFIECFNILKRTSIFYLIPEVDLNNMASQLKPKYPARWFFIQRCSSFNRSILDGTIYLVGKDIERTCIHEFSNLNLLGT